MGLCQPVDVGINKSLKSEVQKLWKVWMVDFSLSKPVTVPPTLLDVAEWMMDAYNLSEQIVCNEWMKNGYAWFINGEEVKDRNGGVHTGGNDAFL